MTSAGWVGGRIGLVTLLATLTAGCVSTTTGSAPPPERNDEDAAQQYYQLGARYYRNGTYELARDRLERSLEYSPRYANAHLTLALTYEELENLRLATEHYEMAVRYGPDNYEVRNAYGVFLCRYSNFDEAQAQFDRLAKEKKYDNAEIMLTNAGVCMSQKPDFDQAEAYFREAIRKP